MKTVEPILTSRSTVKTQIDALLTDFYAQHVAAAQHITPAYHDLWRSMQLLNAAGGKRIRPYLCIMAYEALNGEDSQRILPVAAAQELLHGCLLMHDDIIDHDYVRYGVPNIAGQARQRYAKLTDDAARATHYANGAALLAGDLLLSSAHQLIAGSDLSPVEIAQSQAYLYEAVVSVAAGELLDSEASLQAPDAIDALQIAELKTAGYSFTIPLISGAALAGATPLQLAALRELGTALGIAFQLTDDILGVFGETAQTGKSNKGDITEGKRTYLLQATLNATDDAGRAFLNQRLGRSELLTTDFEQIRAIMRDSGGLAATQSIARSYADQALEILAKLELSAASEQAFTALITSAIERTK